MSNELSACRRSLVLYLLCLGVLMVVLDTTIVAVALPSIMDDLRLSGTSLTWMVNAYTLSFGGFLLLSGRLGDLYGARRLFLIGITLFMLASLACGLAHRQTLLLIARAVQGLGSAMVTAVSLSLITNLFSKPDERARAMGTYGFVCAAGGSVGELLGGFLTHSLSWHWIFLVNLPIGIVVYMFSILLIPRDAPARGTRQLDVAGAVTITAALSLLVYALINSNEAGWRSIQTEGVLSVVTVLLVLFISIEIRVQEPLVPLRLFQLRNLATANLLGILWGAGAVAWSVIFALYLQRVLGYDPLRVGLAFLPATVIMALFSVGLSAKLVMRFGTRGPLWIGLLLFAMGLALFAHAPLGGTFTVNVLPGMLLLGLGGGMASTPLLLAAMSDIESEESGLASGVFNTSFMMGSAVGLAVLASLADARTGNLVQSGAKAVVALNAGYHCAFLVGALLTGIAAVLGALVLRRKAPTNAAHSATVVA